MEEAINTWIKIEDDEDIQKAEMEDEIERLEQSTEEDVQPEEEEEDPRQLESNIKVDRGAGIDFQTAESPL
jgi:hypothetical protein